MANRHLLAAESHFFINGLQDYISHTQETSTIQLAFTQQSCVKILRDWNPSFLWCAFRTPLEELISSFLPSVRQGAKDVQIILFRNEVDIHSVQLAFDAGVTAYLDLDCVPDEVDQAIRALQSSQIYLGHSIRETIALKVIFKSEKKNPNSNNLTPRETEVLRLIVDEHTTREIAAKLFISKCTVETHRIHLIRKLDVKNTAGLVRKAMINRLYV